MFAHVVATGERAVLRGRRFGNLVIAASAAPLPAVELGRRGSADPVPARTVAGPELDRFDGGAAAVTDKTAVPSPVLPPDLFGGGGRRSRNLDG